MAKKNNSKMAHILQSKTKSIQNKDQRIVELLQANAQISARIASLTCQITEKDAAIHQLNAQITELTDKLLASEELSKTATNQDARLSIDRNETYSRIANTFPQLRKSVLRDIVDAEVLYCVAKDTSSCYCAAMLAYAKAAEAILADNLKIMMPRSWHEGITFGEMIGPLYNIDPLNPDIYWYEKIKEYRDRAAHHSNNPIRKNELVEIRHELLEWGLLHRMIERPYIWRNRKTKT